MFQWNKINPLECFFIGIGWSHESTSELCVGGLSNNDAFRQKDVTTLEDKPIINFKH